MATRKQVEGWRHVLDELRRQAFKMKTVSVPEAAFADVAGLLREVETVLAEVRKGILNEAVECEGEEYDIVVTRRADRTYNAPAIITKMMDKTGRSMSETMIDLMDRGALRYTWQWTALKRVLWKEGIDLIVAPREVGGGDLDGPLVGEVWVNETRVIPKGGVE